MPDDLVRDGGSIQRDGDLVLLGLVDAFANRFGHFVGLAEPPAHSSLAVSHDHQCAEAETPPAFDHFGNAFDLDDFINQIYLFSGSILQRSSSCWLY